MAQEANTKKKKLGLTKSFLKGLTLRILVFLLLIVFLYQFAIMFNQMVFINRLDDSGAVAFRYAVSTLPFNSQEVILNFSGEKVTLLNVSTKTEALVLYTLSFTSQEIKTVSVLEKNEQTFLVVWSSEVFDGEDYIIYGKFVNFYKYGTKEVVSVLQVDEYHEASLLDDIYSSNKFLLNQITLMLVIVVASSILALLGLLFWSADKLSP